MKSREFYRSIRKPRWAPPAKIFSPVWTFLYVVIAASYGYVAYAFFAGGMPLAAAVPFALNLAFNIAYSPLQFGLRNFFLGSIDILLVLATLVWAMGAIYPYAPWVALVNIPYLAWVLFATVLQLAVAAMNS